MYIHSISLIGEMKENSEVKVIASVFAKKQSKVSLFVTYFTYKSMKMQF